MPTTEPEEDAVKSAAGWEDGWRRPGSAKRKLLFFSLVLVVVLIGFLHFFTAGSHTFYHNTYRRLSYFPIVLGGLWFGVSGGLTLAVLSSIAFIPHVLLYVDQGPARYGSELTEILLYLAAGLLVGGIAGRETRLREQYEKLSKKLERSYARLHEETAQLLDVEAQLATAQKFSALGQLSASLAHEIKNPLSSIKGTAEILLDDFPGEHPKREFAEILCKEAARLNATVEEVLHYSRGRRGRDEPREPLAAVLCRLETLLESRLRGKSIVLEKKDIDSLTDFMVAGGKISQVFLNLLLNAIDAVPVGGHITLKADRRPDGCLIVVADNGPGVPEHDKERIFEPFFSGKEGGTGLGLVISKKILESHGGTITVADSPEGGAEFRVFLPGQEQAAVPDVIVDKAAASWAQEGREFHG